MAFVTEPFQACLLSPLENCDVTFSISNEAYADLMHLLSAEGSYTYLSIKDSAHFETVKAYIQNNCLMLERGQGGTTPAKFFYGACISTISPTVLASIQGILGDIKDSCVWHYNPDAMGGHLSFAQRHFPIGTHGQSWRGHIVLGGTLPVTASIISAPNWLSITQHDNMIELIGIPPTADTYVVEINAKNTQESININQTYNIIVR